MRGPVNVHGGGYVTGAGESGTPEGIRMAGLTGLKVIAVDYRMPPDHAFPAGMDDAIAVWKELDAPETRELYAELARALLPIWAVEEQR